MKIAWHLHLHQPPTQFPFVVTQISNNCYRPLLALLNDNSGLRVTMSVSASLLEWWDRLCYSDLPEALRYLVGRGQIELVGSGAYHPILTLLPEEEAVRQIKLEEEVLENVILSPVEGSLRSGLKGFFSPEMAIDQHLIFLLSGLAYQWILADEVAALEQPHFLQIADLPTSVVIRDRGASLAVAFGYAQTLPSFKNMVEQYSRFQDHLVLVLDGETFGHHWPGALEFLKEVATEGSFTFVTISELLKGQELVKIPQVTECTWGTSNADLARGELYPKWKMQRNELHELQWQLTELAIKTVGADPCVGPQKSADGRTHGFAPTQSSRELLDRALHSDQYWWASHNPYWNMEMVERGARMLCDVAGTPVAEKLYNSIVTRGKELYGEEVVTG